MTIVTQDGESVVNDGAEFGVDVFRDILTGPWSVPGPVNEVTHHVLIAIWNDVFIVSYFEGLLLK